jgi:hypothetical protein
MKKTFIVAIIALSLLSGLPTAVFSDSEADISLNPANQEVVLGNQFSVTLHVDNASGLNTDINTELVFDSSKVTFQDIAISDTLTNLGWSFLDPDNKVQSCLEPSPDCINIFLMGPGDPLNSVEGSADIATIYFSANSTGTNDLSFNAANSYLAGMDMDYNWVQLPASWNPAAVTIAAPATNYTISGSVKYYDGVKIVPNATVILENSSGTPIATALTNSSGFYQFTNVAGASNYAVRVTKSDGASGLSGTDQTKIRRHIVGLEIFDTIYKIIAGDVNDSGTLSGTDQTKIRRFIVGLDSGLPSGAWKFYSTGATLTTSNYLTTGLIRNLTNLSSDLLNQDFTGIKMGDVNNSWVSN